MKKLRVFQTVKSKRIVSGFSMKNLGTVLLLLFSPGWPQVHDVDQAMKNLNTRASASQVLEL